MEKENIDELKQIRDKLSFVIFALCAKNQHNLPFSLDEARGCKDILSEISNELSENCKFIESSNESESSTIVEQEIESKAGTEPIDNTQW
jgi:hypothetical protein